MDALAGGYFVVGRGAAPPKRAGQPSLLPNWLWTPTSCLCELYPATWAYKWAQYSDSDAASALEQLGLRADEMETVQGWVDEKESGERLSFTSAFDDLNTAREFVTRFARRRGEIKILGVGLAEQDAATFFDETRDEHSERSYGLHRVLSRRRTLEPGHTIGFEPLGMEYGGDFHSFICNGLDADYCERLGLRLNEHGRFDAYQACRAAVDYTNLDSTGAEPVLWLPWAVVEYALE